MLSQLPPTGVSRGITPCAHSHSTRPGVLWPVRLSHTSNSRSGGRSCGNVKGLVRPACHTAQAAGVAAGSCDGAGGGSSARIALRCSRSHGCRTALVPRAADCSRTWPVAGWNRVRILVVPPRMYSCGCVAGWPRGRHDTPGCGTAWTGPASSSHQTESPSCAPSVSACSISFFGHRIGIADAHHTVLARAHHHAGFAPGAALLPAQAARVQGAPNRERADPGQPVIGLPQGSRQQAQRPSRRAVLLALGRAGPFGQNALLRISAIADPWSAPMAGPHGGEPVAVEAADPGGDRLVVPSSDLVGGSRVARAISNGQQHSGALDLRGGGAERAAQAGQLLALIRSERAKGIFPVARHGTPRGTRIASPPYQIPRQSTH